MRPIKQDALNAINALPDDTDMEEIMYHLYVLDKIRKAQEAAAQGRSISSDALIREIEQQW